MTPLRSTNNFKLNGNSSEKAATPKDELLLRISWASDLHFDHADQESIQIFYDKLNKQRPRLLLLAGDIDLGRENPVYSLTGETIPANGLISTLKKINESISCKIFFVCGNHDFYFSSFEKVRKSIHELSHELPNITYVHETEGIELDPQTVLLGHDGWADGRAGNFAKSRMILKDFFLIEDLKVDSAKQIFTAEMKLRLENLGNASAIYAETVLPRVFKIYTRALFLTHAPPFREASRHKDAICDDQSAPFFVNQSLGDAFLKIMKQHPKNQLTVLCGHTHTATIYQPLGNLVILTAGAEYGDPKPQDPLFF